MVDSWSRLEQSDKAMFFAALVRAAMTKPALGAEMSVYIAVLKDWQAKLSASWRPTLLPWAPNPTNLVAAEPPKPV